MLTADHAVELPLGHRRVQRRDFPHTDEDAHQRNQGLIGVAQKLGAAHPPLYEEGELPTEY